MQALSVGLLLLTGSLAAACFAQPASASDQVSVPGNVAWFDTGVTVTKGEKVTFAASGTITIGFSAANDQTPAGDAQYQYITQGADPSFLAPNLVIWSLIGKIGASGNPFQVGAGATVTAYASDELYLSINDNIFDDNEGSWQVSLQRGVDMCGDQRDTLISQYMQYHVRDVTSNAPFVPVCSDFTQTAQSQYYSFSDLNVSNLIPPSNCDPDNPTYIWALIRYPLTVDQSSGFGLDAWYNAILTPPKKSPYAFPHTITSAYRSPAHNAEACVGGARGSRHMFGDAVDLQNVSHSESEFRFLSKAAIVAHADYKEPIDGPCKLNCVHADWRAHPGPYSQ